MTAYAAPGGLQAMLPELDALPLECDGMTRVISTLLLRDGVAHEVAVGALEVKGVGTIPLHWWIQFEDGVICDLRARMWLGQGAGVPHGLFVPQDGYLYAPKHLQEHAALPPFLFHFLAGAPLEKFRHVVPEHTHIQRHSSHVG